MAQTFTAQFQGVTFVNNKPMAAVINAHASEIFKIREGSGIAVLQPDAGAYGSSYQIDVTFTQESTTASAVYPSVGDVDLSIQYGPNGADYTGTLEQPDESDVLVGVQYGAGGTEFTGSATGGGGFISIINE